MLAPLRLATLLLLVSLPAFAQSLDPWDVDPVRPESSSSPQLPEPSPARWTPAARYAVQFGAGSVGFVLGTLAGGGAGFGGGLALCGLAGPCLERVVLTSAALGGLAGTALAVSWTGGALRGRGSAWAAAGGALVGCAATAFAASAGHQDLLVPFALSAPVLAVTGYALTDDGPESVQVTPSVALDPRSGAGRFGLQGSF